MRGARPQAALDAVILRDALVPAGGHVVVACSGGPDSVALASILDRLGRRTPGFGMTLVHVNHGLRPSAWQDECVVLAVGARLGRPVRIVSLTPPRPDEATLRELRYEALRAAATELGAAAVATAHSAEDQTESVLLALFRGTGPRGLLGIPVRRALGDGVDLVRPLLPFTHADLAAEAARAALPYARDPTNRQTERARNAVRAAAAELRSTFPSLDRAVARCARLLREDLSGEERGRRRRRIRALLERLGEDRDVTFERIDAAASLAPDRRIRRIHLKRGLELAIGDDLDAPRIIRPRD